MRLLTLEGRIKILKSLAVSEVIHLLLIPNSNNSISLLYKTKILFGTGRRQKLNKVFITAMKRGV